MTITNAKIVRDILANGGKDEDGFVYPRIYAYTPRIGTEQLYSLFTDPAFDDMETSPYVRSYYRLMANGVLTENGQSFLNQAV